MPGTFSLTLVLTHACDFACEYCSAGLKSARRLEEPLGRRAIERALRTLEAAAGGARGAVLDLGFFGGEPLLEWPLAERLLAFARAEAAPRGVLVRPQLTTNGSRVDARLAAALVGLGVATAVSMDGLPEVHDGGRRLLGGQPTSGKALAAIDRLAALGAPPTVVSVVRPSSVDHLPAGSRFLADRGVRSLRPSLDHGAPWRRVDGPRLAAAVAALGRLHGERFPALSISWIDAKLALLSGIVAAPPACGFGRDEVALAPSGRLYPCERLVEDDRPGPYAMGHVLDAEGPYAPLERSCVPGEASGCAGCGLRARCSSSCACANIARTGSPDRPDGLICLFEEACLAAARDAGRAILARAAATRSPAPLPVLA